MLAGAKVQHCGCGRAELVAVGFRGGPLIFTIFYICVCVITQWRSSLPLVTDSTKVAILWWTVRATVRDPDRSAQVIDVL